MKLFSLDPLCFSTHLKGFVQPRLHEWLRTYVSPLTLYSSHFFDVILSQSLQKLAFTLTSIPAVLQASSLLPLDPPSHGNVALSYPSKLLMRPNLRFHTQTHVHTSARGTHACTLKPNQFSWWYYGSSWLCKNLFSICQFFFTHLRRTPFLCLLLSSFPAFLSLGRWASMCLWSLKPLESGTTTQITSTGGTDRMDTVT